MDYQGHDRRRHRVYVTRNTEYHLRDGVCVAVRDRQTRRFRDAHIALRLRMEGRIKISLEGGAAPSPYEPRIGDAIFFLHTTSDGRERQITTSRVERIERPAKEDVLQYRL
jgi:hypothetical protein